MGLNNLHLSVAMGGALVICEVALGTSLKIGVTLHNTTKALSIVASIGKEKPKDQIVHPLELGIRGGGPTIVDA
jgi:hypothetical protein